MPENFKQKQIDIALCAVFKKWKPAILCRLNQQGAIRFTELLRSIPLTTNQPITKKVLIQQLRELEEHGLIERKIFPEVPPRVEYNLTDYGKSTQVVIEEMIKWGESFGENSQQI